MQKISKLFVYAVLACLLLSWAAGMTRPRHLSRAANQLKRDKPAAAARLRRWRDGPPSYRPVRLGTAAFIPPDDDEVSGRARLSGKSGHECLPALHTEQASHRLALFFQSKPRGNDVPLHQALCLLLI